MEIGYNSGQFHHRGKLSEADQKACINAGLLIPYSSPVPNATGNTYKVFAKDCIICPLKNKQNQIVTIYGRSITNNNYSKYYYLKDRCGLYPSSPSKINKIENQLFIGINGSENIKNSLFHMFIAFQKLNLEILHPNKRDNLLSNKPQSKTS